MYVNFPRREGMRKRGCMLSGGDLDAARTIWVSKSLLWIRLGNSMRVNEAGALDVSEVLSKMKYVQARYSSKRS